MEDQDDEAWSIKEMVGRDLAERGSEVHRVYRMIRAVGGHQICSL